MEYGVSMDQTSVACEFGVEPLPINYRHRNPETYVSQHNYKTINLIINKHLFLLGYLLQEF